MNYDILILTLAFINLAIGLALLYFVIKKPGGAKGLSDGKYDHLNNYFDDLLERIQRVEKDHPVYAIANLEKNIPQDDSSGANRVKSVLEKLRNGENPNSVRKEHGYSGSEMSLILAAAGLSGDNAGSI